MRLPIRWRRSLSRPLEAVPVRIRNGPNRGRRWSLPVSGRGFTSGSFEADKFEALDALLAEADVFWDVGAHYGYATLLGARSVGQHGSVWSFEPSSLNRSYLRRHVAWNCPGRVTVKPFALADEDGTETFGGSGSSMVLGLGRGDEEVQVRSFVSLLADGLPEPTMVKVDVEGAESRMLRGMLASASRPTVMCSVHDPEELERCVGLLKDAGYLVLPSSPIRAFVNGRRSWSGDPDIVALPADADDRRVRLETTKTFRDMLPL